MPRKTLLLLTAFLLLLAVSPAFSSCTGEFIPVCGKDSRTYWNECMLKELGAEKDYNGACGNHGCPLTYDPVCAQNNESYINECFMKEEGAELKHEGLCPLYCPMVCLEIDTFRERACAASGITYPNQCLLECFEDEFLFLGYCFSSYQCGDSYCTHRVDSNILGEPESEYLRCEEDCGTVTYTMDSQVKDHSSLESPFQVNVVDVNFGPFNPYSIKAKFYACFSELEPGKGCDKNTLMCEGTYYTKKYSCNYILLPGEYDLYVELWHPDFDIPINKVAGQESQWIDDIVVTTAKEFIPEQNIEPQALLGGIIERLMRKYLPAEISDLLLSSAFYGYSWLYLFMLILSAAAGYLTYRESFIIFPEIVESKKIRQAKLAARITASLLLFFAPIIVSAFTHESIGFALALIELALVPLATLFAKRFLERRDIRKYFVE